MDNVQVADVFDGIASLLELKGELVFTVRAYRRAARTIRRLPDELGDTVAQGRDLREIPGVGKAIADKIAEIVRTGRLAYYQRLEDELPGGVPAMTRVPGLGPKTILRLWKELNVTSVGELEAAIEGGRVAALPGMGRKTAENLLKQVRAFRSRDGRMPIVRAARIADRVAGALRERCASVQRLAVAGGVRRFEETVGDIDLVCCADEPGAALDALATLAGVEAVVARDDRRAVVRLGDGIQVDLNMADATAFGSALQRHTGSRAHNGLVREHAKSLGLDVDGDALVDGATGRAEAFADERALYARLGLQYVPPELRQGACEVDAAKQQAMPALIVTDDVRGDLHVHTDWSDGRDSMEAMVDAAQARGLEYVAITDHSVGRAIASGLSIGRLRQRLADIRGLATRLNGITVLCGTEMDIRADGTLDYPDDLLSDLDWVVASVHSAMGQDPARMTERILAAMRNPHVDAIGHLTTRLLGERAPIEADFEALFRAAAETGTALEVNASPSRLDLKDVHVNAARQLGVALVISTDAHAIEELDNMRHGVMVARRGWCRPGDILNTRPLVEFQLALAAPKPERRWGRLRGQ